MNKHIQPAEFNPTDWVPPEVGTITNHQTDLPRIARDSRLTTAIESRLAEIPTIHDLYNADALSSFNAKCKGKLHELCKIMGLPGKLNGMDGGQVEQYFREGRLKEIADYCESDVVNTYRLWLRYELFRGRLSEQEFQASEANLSKFLSLRESTKPHLAELITYQQSEIIIVAEQDTPSKAL